MQRALALAFRARLDFPHPPLNRANEERDLAERKILSPRKNKPPFSLPLLGLSPASLSFYPFLNHHQFVSSFILATMQKLLDGCSIVPSFLPTLPIDVTKLAKLKKRPLFNAYIICTRAHARGHACVAGAHV